MAVVETEDGWLLSRLGRRVVPHPAAGPGAGQATSNSGSSAGGGDSDQALQLLPLAYGAEEGIGCPSPPSPSGPAVATPRPWQYAVHEPYLAVSKRARKRRRQNPAAAAALPMDEAAVAAASLSAFLEAGLRTLLDASPTTTNVASSGTTTRSEGAPASDEEIAGGRAGFGVELAALCGAREFDEPGRALRLAGDCGVAGLERLVNVRVTNSHPTCAARLFVRPSAPDAGPQQFQQFLVPPRSTFAMSDIGQLDALLLRRGTSSAAGQAPAAAGQFDLVVMDPPWENKSARRGSQYHSLREHELVPMPVGALVREGGLVAVWVTNKDRFFSFTTKHLFAAWGIQWVATWYWLKVTTSGEPVIPFASSHKRPYEAVLIGRRGPAAEDDGLQVPRRRFFASVPSRLHSKKPNLLPILRPHLLGPDGREPRCCELFARHLTAGWTSWGNEALLHQNARYFEARP